jgi:hypothetical protein
MRGDDGEPVCAELAADQPWSEGRGSSNGPTALGRGPVVIKRGRSEVGKVDHR